MPRSEKGTSKPFLRGDTWYIRYTVPGEEKERRESTGFRKEQKEDAKQALRDKLKDIDDGKITPRSATVGDLLDLLCARHARQETAQRGSG